MASRPSRTKPQGSNRLPRSEPHAKLALLLSPPARSLTFTPIMNVKLLDLQSQYLPLRAEIRRAIDEVCDAQSLCLGPAVERFEKNLAQYCGTKHAVGVSSGTDAILCALMAIDIKPGDEVIVPAFTFFATAGCV